MNRTARPGLSYLPALIGSAAAPQSASCVAAQPSRQGRLSSAGHGSGAWDGAAAARRRAVFRLRGLLADRLQVPRACDARKVSPDLHIGRYAKQADQGDKGYDEPPVQHMLTHCLSSATPKVGGEGNHWMSRSSSPARALLQIAGFGRIGGRVRPRPEPASACLRRRAPP